MREQILEDHQKEQYFFTTTQLDKLTAFIEDNQFKSVACLCAPTLGRQLSAPDLQSLPESKITERLQPTDVEATILDIDQRFNYLDNFHYFNIGRPQPQPQNFDLIICDPPFFTISLSTLFYAVRMLSHYQFDQPVLLSYLHRRSQAVEGTFRSFSLQQTTYTASYTTVDTTDPKRQINWFTNIDQSLLAALA